MTAATNQKVLLKIKWEDGVAKGWTDSLPGDWFWQEGEMKSCVHACRKGSATRYAKCDVNVEANRATLDYSQYKDENERNKIESGQMLVQFKDESRNEICEIKWNGENVNWKLGRPEQIALEDPELDGVTEGRPNWVTHLIRERSPILARNKKNQMKQRGPLECAACKFVFVDRYPSLGEDFCEVHHIKPLARQGERRTKLDHLEILCSNCHRMIHRALRQESLCSEPEEMTAKYFRNKYVKLDAASKDQLI